MLNLKPSHLSAVSVLFLINPKPLMGEAMQQLLVNLKPLCRFTLTLVITWLASQKKTTEERKQNNVKGVLRRRESPDLGKLADGFAGHKAKPKVPHEAR